MYTMSPPLAWADKEGGGGGGRGPDPLENHKAIGFFINTGPNPMENPKLPSQHPMLFNNKSFKYILGSNANP